MTAPIYNPAVPYLGPILGGMVPGKILSIQGTTHPNATRFSINLQCGPNVYTPRDDIALHIDVRFINGTVVRNSLLMQSWGNEETHGPFPFNRGQSFEFMILNERHCFKIAINGLHYAEFPHRTPVERVSYLAVDGDCTLSCIRMEGGSISYAPPSGGLPVNAPPYVPPMPVPAYAGGGTVPPYPMGGSPVRYPRSTSPYAMSQPSVYPTGQIPPPGAPMYPQQAHPGAPPMSYYPATVIHSRSPKISPHSKSHAIPIVGGAAAGMLAGAALFGHHKMKKMKGFKHKHKWMKKAFKHKHKFKYHHGFHGFHHSSSSSSSSEEE